VDKITFKELNIKFIQALKDHPDVDANQVQALQHTVNTFIIRLFNEYFQLNNDGNEASWKILR